MYYILHSVKADSIGICPPSFVEHSSEKPIKVDKFVSSFVNWFQSVLASTVVRKARIMFLTFLLLVSPIITAVKMHDDYNKLETLKEELIMEERKLNMTPENSQSADTMIPVRSKKLEQKSTGLNIV